MLSVDPGIELGLTVFVTSRRYRQTNSAQALRVRVRVGIKIRVRVRVGIKIRVRWGLLPTTSHSIFYGRVGQIAIFSHCQLLGWEDT